MNEERMMIVITTNAIYPWSFVRQRYSVTVNQVIYYGDDKTFEVMTLTLPLGTLSSVHRHSINVHLLSTLNTSTAKKLKRNEPRYFPYFS
jgi:hypothetical protein